MGAQLIGLRGWHNQAHLAASVVEGIVFNHKHHLDLLKTKLEVANQIYVTGGSVNSSVWSQIIADIFNCEILISNTQESGARGMAILAAVATGEYKNISHAIENMTAIERVVTPDASMHAFYQDRYAKYRAHALKLINC